MVEEVSPRRLWDIQLRGLLLHGCHTLGLVRDTLRCLAQVGLDVRAGLDNVSGYVKGVARRLGDRETVVEGDAAGDGAEADDNTPHLVHGLEAGSVAILRRGCDLERVLEPRGHDEGDDACEECQHWLDLESKSADQRRSWWNAAGRDHSTMRRSCRSERDSPAPNCPRPCMAKTEPIMAPRHFVVANSDVMMEESG